MQKYVRFIVGQEQLEFAPVNKGNILNYNLNIEAMVADGYKKFVEVERPETNRRYHIEYEETDENISENIIYDETQEEADEREFNLAKQDKYKENDIKANQHLNRSFLIEVTQEKIPCIFIYNEKTERNLNSSAIMIVAGIITEKEWTDEQGITVNLTHEDIVKIGSTFKDFADQVWARWGRFKKQIDEAETLEQVEAIVIDYTSNEVQE